MTCRLWSQTPSRNFHNTTDIIHTLTARAGQTERYTTLQISFTLTTTLADGASNTNLLTYTHSQLMKNRQKHTQLMQNRQKHTQHYRCHSYTHSSCRTDRNIQNTTDTTHTSCRTDRNIHSTTDIIHTLTAHAEQTERYTALQIPLIPHAEQTETYTLQIIPLVPMGRR